MKVGNARRELKKTKIKKIINVDPSITNQELAEEVGVHRNTVTKYIGEIQEQEEQKFTEQQRRVVNNLEKQGEAIRMELMSLWVDAYHSLYHEKPAELAKISQAKWDLEKDLAKLKLIQTSRYLPKHF